MPERKSDLEVRKQALVNVVKDLRNKAGISAETNAKQYYEAEDKNTDWAAMRLSDANDAYGRVTAYSNVLNYIEEYL